MKTRLMEAKPGQYKVQCVLLPVQCNSIRSNTFSRALRRLHVFASSFDWFTGLSVSFVIGQSDYFGFGFTTLY